MALNAGPITVIVCGYDKQFKHYSFGIIYKYEPCQSRTRHAVVAVGYGTDPWAQEKFLIIKNSWGIGWGE